MSFIEKGDLLTTQTPDALKKFEGVNSPQLVKAKVEILPVQMIHAAWSSLEEITSDGNVNPTDLVQIARVLGGFEALTFAFEHVTEPRTTPSLINDGQQPRYGRQSQQ